MYENQYKMISKLLDLYETFHPDIMQFSKVSVSFYKFEQVLEIFQRLKRAKESSCSKISFEGYIEGCIEGSFESFESNKKFLHYVF